MEMTKEQLEQEIKNNNELQQNEFIAKLKDMVENYSNKALKKSYELTDKELYELPYIINLLSNIK